MSAIGSIKKQTRKLDAQIRKEEGKRKKRMDLEKAKREKEAKQKKLAALKRRK